MNRRTLKYWIDVITTKTVEKNKIKALKKFGKYLVEVAKKGALEDFVLCQGSQGDMHLPLAIIFFHWPVYEMLL